MDRFKVPENVRKELINLPDEEKIQRAIGFQMLKLIDLTDEINKTKKKKVALSYVSQVIRNGYGRGLRNDELLDDIEKVLGVYYDPRN